VRPGIKRKTLEGTAVVGLLVVVVAGLVCPRFHRTWERPHHLVLLNNIKQLACTALIYAEDNHGEFPLTLHALLKDGSLGHEEILDFFLPGSRRRFDWLYFRPSMPET